jgi:hypothetical protein
MIFRLLRRDPAWIMGVGVALGNLAVLPFFPANQVASNLLCLEAFALWFALTRLPYPRATLFEMSLPIPARQIFLARVLSLLALVWTPIVSSLAVIALRWGPASPLHPTILKGGAIATLGACLVLSLRMPERSLPSWLGNALCIGVAAAGGAAWYLLPDWAILLLFGAASAAVLLKTWSAIPPSFQVAPVRAIRASVRPGLPGVMPLAWRPILRSAGLWPVIGTLGFMALLAPTGGWFIMFAWMILPTYSQVRRRSRWLSTLAVSPRALLLIALAASLGPLVGGVVLGTSLGSLHPLARLASAEPPPFVEPEAIESYGPDALIPLEFWRFAPGGRVPSIRAPWGETGRPLSISILGMVLYNPYSAYRASHRFVEWQWMQTSLDLHLGRIPLSQYWPARRTPAPVVFTGDLRFRILCLSALLACGLYLVFVGELSRWHKLRRPSRFALRILLCGLAGLPALAVFIPPFRLSFIPLAKAALFFFERTLPDSLPLVVLIAAVPVLAMYWLLERQFRQSELLGPLTKPEAS